MISSIEPPPRATIRPSRRLTRRRALIGAAALFVALAGNALTLANAGFTPWWHALGAAVGNVVELALVAAVAWGMASRPALQVPAVTGTRLLARHAAAAVAVATLAVALNRVGRLLPHTDTEHHPLTPGPDAVWLACWFLSLYGAVAALAHAVQATARLRERELEATRAELRALRAQFNPHFLFNALHSVGVLVRSDPARAESAVEQLGDLLRYVLRASRTQDCAAPTHVADVEVPLDEELAFVRDYLSVERIRFGARLQVVEEIEPATRHAMVPALLLQPLVENAVKYAVGARREGATVHLVARHVMDAVAGDALRLGVIDDGPGAAKPLAPEPRAPGQAVSTVAPTGQTAGGEGVGLEGLRRRLAACYPDRHRVDVTTPAGGGFAVWLAIPWQTVERTSPGAPGGGEPNESRRREPARGAAASPPPSRGAYA